MRRSVRNGIAGAALLGVGLGVGLGAGWAAGSADGGSASHPSSAKSAVTDISNGDGSPSFHGELVAYNSCDTLLTALRARGRALVGPYGFGNAGIGYGSSTSPFLRGAYAAASPALGPYKSSTQTLPHSDTNNQVVGVDEPDIVKTDGRIMVSLDGQRLHIVDVQNSKLDSTIALPYPGSELLLAGDQVVVLSGGSADQNGGVGGDGGGVLYTPYSYGRSYSSGGSSTTATVVDVSNPDQPRVARSFTFDASELAARVVNGTIRLVLNSPPPTATWATPLNATAAERARTTKINQSIVDALPLDAWLPHWSEGASTTQRASACDSVAIPNGKSASPAVGMVTVLSLDPKKATPGAGTSVFGTASTAYAEGSHLYVSDSGEEGLLASKLLVVPAQQPTTLHLLEFDISDPAQARYLASGTVAGQLHDAYALSEYQDSLRVTTTTSDQSGNSTTGISVLQRRGDKLAQVGDVSNLGPGEQVSAVRYIGDRGYVVTFQQIDPLHVVDLSNPANPVLRGTLELTGYSTLLQPLPNHQLLGIGREVTPTPRPSYCSSPLPPAAAAQCGAPIETTDGLQMTLFDVTDPAHPKLLAKQVLAGAYAVDSSSPHTVTADPAEPAAVHDGGYFVMPSTNGLLGIRVAGNKITLTTAPFSKPYSVQTGRAVFAGDHVFELSDRGVAVRRSSDLGQTGWVAF